MNTQVILKMKQRCKMKMVIECEARKIRAQREVELLGISKRQIRRLVAAFRTRDMAVLAVGNQGKTPVNRISDAVQQKIVKLPKAAYRDYNDCHFTEELAEQYEPVVVSLSKLWRIRRAAG